MEIEEKAMVIEGWSMGIEKYGNGKRGVNVDRRE